MALRRARKAAITLTEVAGKRIHDLLKNKGNDNICGIKLGVRARGCNGMSYTMNYAEKDSIGKLDEKVSQHGVNVYIDPKALFYIVGTEMDYIETDIVSEFKFTNPNSKGSCGCGESFNV